MLKIEAIFGGVLALLILGVAVFMVATTSFNGPGEAPSTQRVVNVGTSPLIEARADADIVCQCYDQGRRLAASGVGVMSSQYRTGFEQCRAIGDIQGGDAWTAGWNAQLSAKPYEASCRAYKKRRRV